MEQMTLQELIEDVKICLKVMLGNFEKMKAKWKSYQKIKFVKENSTSLIEAQVHSQQGSDMATHNENV